MWKGIEPFLKGLSYKFSRNKNGLLLLTGESESLVGRQQSCSVAGHNKVFSLEQVGVNRSSHLGIHNQTNACWSIPRSQMVFYHFNICRKWEL